MMHLLIGEIVLLNKKGITHENNCSSASMSHDFVCIRLVGKELHMQWTCMVSCSVHQTLTFKNVQHLTALLYLVPHQV